MTDWFRSWHGAPTDPKWLGIARKANVAPGIAVAVAWALMDRASQAEDRGCIEGYDADGLACFFGCEPEQVEAIVAAMSDKGMIADGRLTSWEKRQPRREDNSAERAKEWRERKRTQANAPERPDTETDTELDADASSKRVIEREFGDQFWPAYPLKVGKPQALKAFRAARQRASLETIMAGVRRYAAEKAGTDKQFIKQAQGWLNRDGWDDEIVPAANATSPPRRLTQGESIRNMARERGIIDATGKPTGYLDASDRDREDPGSGHIVRLAFAGNLGGGTG